FWGYARHNPTAKPTGSTLYAMYSGAHAARYGACEAVSSLMAFRTWLYPGCSAPPSTVAPVYGPDRGQPAPAGRRQWPSCVSAQRLDPAVTGGLTPHDAVRHGDHAALLGRIIVGPKGLAGHGYPARREPFDPGRGPETGRTVKP